MTYFSRASADDSGSKTIGVIGADGVSSFDLSAALEPFTAARVIDAQGENHRCYETVIIGLERKTFICDSGAVIKAHHTLQTAPPLDTIIVPGGRGLRNSEPSRRITAWLLERAPATRRIAAIAAGIYPLASSGLLKGARVATHWRLAHDVAQMFQDLSLCTASFAKSGRFYTCSGSISAMEMSLGLIDEDFGPQTAFAVAREFSIDVRPPGGAEQPELPEYQPGVTERLAELPAWMTSRLRRDLTVEVLAQRTCLSPRHFYRLFKETFKTTPAAFVEQLRIDEAQRRLAAHRDSIENVAASVGFKSPTVFRRAFGRVRGVPPSSILRAAQAHRRAA